jgi:biotin carboxylase
MTHSQVGAGGAGSGAGGEKPVVIVGFAFAALPSLATFQADRSVVWIEEPDIIRKRQIRELTADAPVVREIFGCEHYLPGKADEFYAEHSDLDPAAIIPLTEYSTPFAARLAERYGLPGAGYGAACVMRNKDLLRKVTRAAGIANPESVDVAGPDDVREFMRASGGPVVLKPANRQASIGVQVIRHEDEIEEAWQACLYQDEGELVPDRPIELHMLAERFLRGSEFSVEMLVKGGEPLFSNVTGKQLFDGDRPVEKAHVIPADIAPELTELLEKQTRLVLEAVGFDTGIVHCEWIVEDGVPYVVECAGRFAGDGIIGLIEKAYGFPLIIDYYDVMKNKELKDLPTKAERGTVVRFLTLGEPGVVADVRGLEEARKLDGVVSADVELEVGDTFHGLRSSWDRTGDIVVEAPTSREALRIADEAAALIEVELRAADVTAERAGAPA